jgi:hypothetical protein
MPRKPFTNFLPDHVLQKLNEKLKQEGFSNYYAVADWFNDLLEAEGLELRVQKSTIGRYGQDFERKLSQLSTATLQAQAIVNAAQTGDGQAEMSEALTLLVQKKLFETLLDLDDESLKENFDITRAARAIADLSRSSISTKKFAAQVRERVNTARSEIKEIKEIKGMSEETQKRIDEILGAITVSV